MSAKIIEGAKATATISYPDGRKQTFDLTSVRFEESLPADRSYPAFFLEGKVNGRSLSFSCPKGKVPDIVDDPARPPPPARRIGMGIGYAALMLTEALKVMRSDAASDPARRADAIAALDRYWPEWRLTDPEILGFRAAATIGDGLPLGNNTILYGPVAKRKATPAEEAQRARDEERKSIPPWTILGPSSPVLPLKPEHRVSYPTPHKTCVCDIKDLMSTGHRSGCPEKKG